MSDDPLCRGSADTSRWSAVCLSLLLVTSIAIVGVAAASSTAAAANTTSNPIEFSYVDGSSGNITVVRQDGTTLALPNSQTADALGPARQLDNDSATEVPYVDSNGNVWMIDTNGNETQLASDAKVTKVTTADWDGNGQTEIIYANSSGAIYRVENGSTATQIADPADQAGAVLGAANFTADNETDIVYTGTSANLYYYNESSGSTKFFSSTLGAIDAAGEPADFNGDGTLEVPFVDGSANIALVDANDSKRTLTSNGNNDNAAVAAANWTGDSDPEVIYLNSSNVYSVSYEKNVDAVRDSNENQLNAAQDAGIATFHPGPTPLNVSNFTLTNTTGQNVTVSFDSNEELSAAEVDLSGAENATLTRSDFTESGSYTYTATYEGSTDGNYTATLQYAESMDGDRFDQNLSDSTVVDALAPTVVSANVSAADGDGLVGPGDQFSVTANVSGDVDQVRADLSAFGAGTPSESVDLDGGETTVNFTASVDETQASADGNYSVDVVAEDDQGNTDSATTPETLTLDTTPPSVDAGENRTVTEGDSVNFSATVSDENGIDSYEWAFGTGDSATGQSPSYTYDTAGDYTVTVEVTDDAGNTASDSLTVSVEQADDGSGGSGGSTSDSSDSDSSGSDDGGTTSSTVTPTAMPTAMPTATPTATPAETPESSDTPTAVAREAPETPTPTVTPTETPSPTAEQTDDSAIPVPVPSEAGAAGAGFLAILLVLLAARVVQRLTSTNSR